MCVCIYVHLQFVRKLRFEISERSARHCPYIRATRESVAWPAFDICALLALTSRGKIKTINMADPSNEAASSSSVSEEAPSATPIRDDLEKIEDFLEPDKKRRKLSRNDGKAEQKLEHRLGGILCCAVCLDLPKAAVYQVSFTNKFFIHLRYVRYILCNLYDRRRRLSRYSRYFSRVQRCLTHPGV